MTNDLRASNTGMEGRKNKVRIMRTIAMSNRPLSTREIADELDVDLRTVSKHINELANERIVCIEEAEDYHKKNVHRLSKSMPADIFNDFDYDVKAMDVFRTYKETLMTLNHIKHIFERVNRPQGPAYCTDNTLKLLRWGIAPLYARRAIDDLERAYIDYLKNLSNNDGDVKQIRFEYENALNNLIKALDQADFRVFEFMRSKALGGGSE